MTRLGGSSSARMMKCQMQRSYIQNQRIRRGASALYQRGTASHRTKTTMNIQAWDVSLPSIPQREALFPLEPIGIGTPFVENLWSFLNRLADNYHVTTTTLIDTELLPRLVKSRGYALPGTKSFNQQEKQKEPVQGLSRRGEIISLALQHTIGGNKYELLTIWPWGTAFKGRRLLREHKAWCSECYQGWVENNQSIYDPLIWSMDDIDVCGLHKRKLETRCHHCQADRMPINTNGPAGFCPRCKKWLGRKSSDQNKGKPGPCSELALWRYHDIGILLASVEEDIASRLRINIRKGIIKCIQMFCNDDIELFESKAKMASHTLLACWGYTVPSLGDISGMCYCFGVDFLALTSKGEIERNNTSRHHLSLRMQHCFGDVMSRSSRNLHIAIKNIPFVMRNEARKKINKKPQDQQSGKYNMTKLITEIGKIARQRYEKYLAAGKSGFAVRKSASNNKQINLDRSEALHLRDHVLRDLGIMIFEPEAHMALYAALHEMNVRCGDVGPFLRRSSDNRFYYLADFLPRIEQQ